MSWPLLLAAALLLGFLVLPFLALILALPESDVRALTDGDAQSALAVSLFAATAATAIDAVFGIPLGLWLASTRARARHLVTAAVLLPLAVPPVVGGLELILLVGPNGLLGRQLDRLGLNPLDTIAGAVLAQMLVAAPFVVISARAAFESVDPSVGEAGRLLGCGPTENFFRVLLPSARRGIVVGLVLGWVRCLGEFGATAVVAYHPYTLPTLTYVDLSGQGLRTALPVGALLASVGAAIAVGLLWLERRARAGAGRRSEETEAPERIGTLDWVAVESGGTEGLRVRAAAKVDRFELDVAFASASSAVAILGPSGAGKSLTLRTIAGLLRPTVGSVTVGQDLLVDTSEGVDVAPEQRRLGYVAQRDGLFDHLDVDANIAFGLRNIAPTERQRRVNELLAATGLTRVRDQRPATLSAGERQRVALARALAPGPHALLLDEPFSNLDAPIRRQLRRLVREVHERTAVPLVVVTHDREDALDIADFVVILERGRVVQQGRIDEVFARPVTSSVARLVGIPNVLAVRGVETKSSSTVRARTTWGTCSVEAPAERAEAWSLAVPVDAVRLDADGARASIHSCRPAAGGWRLILAASEAESLEALISRDQLPARPIAGGHVRVRIAGERCHLMPWQSPEHGRSEPGDGRVEADAEASRGNEKEERAWS